LQLQKKMVVKSLIYTTSPSAITRGPGNSF